MAQAMNQIATLLPLLVATACPWRPFGYSPGLSTAVAGPHAEIRHRGRDHSQYPDGPLHPSLSLRTAISHWWFGPTTGAEPSVIADQWGMDLIAAYGVSDGVQVGLKIPLGHVSGPGLDGPMGGDTVEREAGFGISDIRLTPKYTLLGTERVTPLAYPPPSSYAHPLECPLASWAHRASPSPSVAAEAQVDGVVLTANVGYRYRLENDVLGNVENGDVVTYGLSMLVGLDYYALEMLGEIFNRPVEPISDRSVSKPMEGLLGLRYRTPFGASSPSPAAWASSRPGRARVSLPLRLYGIHNPSPKRGRSKCDRRRGIGRIRREVERRPAKRR